MIIFLFCYVVFLLCNQFISSSSSAPFSFFFSEHHQVKHTVKSTSSSSIMISFCLGQCVGCDSTQKGGNKKRKDKIVYINLMKTLSLSLDFGRIIFFSIFKSKIDTECISRACIFLFSNGFSLCDFFSFYTRCNTHTRTQTLTITIMDAYQNVRALYHSEVDVPQRCCCRVSVRMSVHKVI